MPGFRCCGPASLFAALALAAPAHADTMVFIKKGDVWMAKDNGSRQIAITRDGKPGRPYFSPSVADHGTIVALKGIHLHSFRPNGRRIVPARQWAINPSPTLSTEPFTVDLSPNGRIVATHNGIYSTYYDPRTSQTRPEIEAQFVDFFDFRTNKEVGKTDGYYDYGAPSWLGSDRALTTSYGPYNAQVLLTKVGDATRGTDFYWNPGRFSDTGMNTHILTDAEATRAGDRFAVMRRPVLGADADDPERRFGQLINSFQASQVARATKRPLAQWRGRARRLQFAARCLAMGVEGFARRQRALEIESRIDEPAGRNLRAYRTALSEVVGIPARQLGQFPRVVLWEHLATPEDVDAALDALDEAL